MPGGSSRAWSAAVLAFSAKLRPLAQAMLAAAAQTAAAGTLMLMMCADQRIVTAGAAPSTPVAVRQAMRNGPAVAPVGRVRPHMPLWPAALVAAGDIVPPVLAPDMAPLPHRRDAAMARAFLQADAKAQIDTQAAAEATRTALSVTGASVPAPAGER